MPKAALVGSVQAALQARAAIREAIKLIDDNPQIAEALTRPVIELTKRIPGLHRQTEPTPKRLKSSRDLDSFQRVGHKVIEDLAALWEAKDSWARQAFVNRFQELLQSFSETGSLGSHELNQLGVRWVSGITKKCHMKLFSGDEAVTVLCARVGKEGWFTLRRARGKAELIRGSGSRRFPLLRAVSLGSD